MYLQVDELTIFMVFFLRFAVLLDHVQRSMRSEVRGVQRSMIGFLTYGLKDITAQFSMLEVSHLIKIPTKCYCSINTVILKLGTLY